MTLRIMLVFALVVALAASGRAATLADSKAVVEDFVSISNNRDFDRLGEVVSERFVRHCQATPQLAVKSLSEFRAYLEADAAVCPDSRVEVQQMIAEGDRVAIWATYTGTQEGAMGPFPPSGKRMVLEFSSIFRIEEGKIAEMWVIWDNMSALTQLGHVPGGAAD